VWTRNCLHGGRENARQTIEEDLALIVRGEELNLPWRRLCVLLDYGLVRLVTPTWMGGIPRW
jgi:hypothetical protein